MRYVGFPGDRGHLTSHDHDSDRRGGTLNSPGQHLKVVDTFRFAYGGVPQQEPLPLTIIVPVLYIRSGSADIFTLRSHALQFLGPATVGAYHNLIPLCTIALAPLMLGEPVNTQTILGTRPSCGRQDW